MVEIANPERGDVKITFDDHEFVMRPTYKAMIEIENITGDGLVTIARRVMSTDYKFSDAIAVVTAGLRAAGEPASEDKVGEMIHQKGLLTIGPELVEFLTNALTGGEEGEGEAKAAGPKKSRTKDSPPSPTPT